MGSLPLHLTDKVFSAESCQIEVLLLLFSTGLVFVVVVFAQS